MPPRVSEGRSWAAAELEPPVGPATCAADPPSLCADWGRRETLPVLVPVLQQKHRHRGARERTDSGVESPSGKPRHGGGRGASDPPGSCSGCPQGKLGRGGSRPRRCPLGSHSRVPQRETGAAAAAAAHPRYPSRLLFEVLSGQETAGTLRTPRFPLGVPLPRLGSGRIRAAAPQRDLDGPGGVWEGASRRC